MEVKYNPKTEYSVARLSKTGLRIQNLNIPEEKKDAVIQNLDNRSTSLQISQEQ